MSAIRFVNNLSANIAGTVEFRMMQGDHMVARIGVAAGGTAAVPVGSHEYTVQAVSTMGEFTLTSAPLDINSASLVLVAEVLEEDGFYDFKLVQQPGTQLSTITCENTWSAPVQFKVSRPGSPFQFSFVVDANNETGISTEQRWSVYAIANGITCPAVVINSPDATVTAVANSGGGFVLVVS